MVLRSSPLSTLVLLAAYFLGGGSQAPLAATTVNSQPIPIIRPASSSATKTPLPSYKTQSSRLVLGYYAQFSQWDHAAQDSLAKHRNRLTSVAPLWFSLSADGALQRRGFDRTALFGVTDSAGLPVLALVTNSASNDAVINDPAARTRAVEALFRLVQENRLGGVNIDFEGLEPWSGPGLTAFMRQLCQRLSPHGYLVTIAVAPRLSDRAADNDWVAAYDYASLAPWVDYMVLMTYDQHWQTGAPGPIAPLWWVENVVKYAVSRVPRQKILLGLAGYGYDWGSGSEAGVVNASEAQSLAAQHGAKIRWDDGASEPTFTYKKNGVAHTVWFENSYSAELRMQLARDAGLAGVALWRLGQEEERLWEAVDRFRSR